jgi:anti-sigma-K factor RskA
MTDDARFGGLTCDEVRDLAASFVLGALDADEMDAVRAHLASCPEAHAEFEELGSVLPALAASVPLVEPPAALKGRVMAAAAVDLASRAPAATATAPAAAATAPAEPLAATPTATVAAPAEQVASAPTATAGAPAEAVAFPSAAEREARTAARARTSPAAWALRIAAVVAIVVLGGWNLVLQGQVNAGKTYEENVAAVLDVAAEPGSLAAILTAEGGDGPAGLAAVSATGDVTMAMRDLAPTTGDQVYEAWVIGGDGVPVPLGGFTAGANGIASFEAGGLPSEPGMVLALTLEPGPGATVPGGPIVSSGAATAPG